MRIALDRDQLAPPDVGHRLYGTVENHQVGRYALTECRFGFRFRLRITHWVDRIGALSVGMPPSDFQTPLAVGPIFNQPRINGYGSRVGPSTILRFFPPSAFPWCVRVGSSGGLNVSLAPPSLPQQTSPNY